MIVRKVEKRHNSIYAMYCKENGRVYIGRSHQVEVRVRQHFCELRSRLKLDGQSAYYKKSNFEADFEKYGESGFEVYIIEENVPFEKAAERERFWIGEYKSFDTRYGYNKSRGVGHTNLVVQHGLPPRKCETQTASFWDFFSAQCLLAGVTPNWVASELDIPSGSVTAWKNGATPRPATIKKVADYFGCTVDDLVKGGE
jgi:hypothetical protein